MKKRTKVAMVGAFALAAGGAGVATATGAVGDNSSHAITGKALERASDAALKATGGGQVTETEVGDEESYYQVEVTKADGSQTDIQLDQASMSSASPAMASHTTQGASDTGKELREAQLS